MTRWTIILSLLLPATATAAAPAVRLRAEARVGGGEVRLADVAVLADLPGAAGEVVVGRLDGDRPSGQVSLADVQAALRRAGINPVPIRFCGAARCTLRRGGPSPALPTAPRPRPDSPSDAPAPAAAQPPTLTERIVAELAAALQVEPETLTVTFPDRLASVLTQRPSGEVTLASNDRRRLGRRRWVITFTTAAGRQRRCHVSAEVTVARRAVVAARTLERGAIVGPDDVRVATIDDDGSEAWMIDPEGVIGQRVRRDIPAAAAVAASDLEQPILVRRGQMLDVRCGPVSLKAIALDQGRAGEWIEVENPRSERTFRAVVTAATEATVAPGGAAGEATP